jgi:hypothetical protein
MGTVVDATLDATLDATNDATLDAALDDDDDVAEPRLARITSWNVNVS